jgi:hypothetical protein
MKVTFPFFRNKNEKKLKDNSLRFLGLTYFMAIILCGWMGGEV